jgi:two-component system, chemotaxis family, CheB/CheR fusion protein
MAKKTRPLRPKAKTSAKTTARRKPTPRASAQLQPAHLVGASEARADPDHGMVPVLVAGVGASAGGFEAFSQLLGSLPANPGLAVVFVQHLSPSHQSALPQLLASTTQLPVEEATDGVIVRPNRIYVTPANVQLRLKGGTLQLSRRPTDRSQYSPIDIFFHSLAEHAESGAIGVLLSGNSSDGVAGLREIRAAGGTVLVQDPQTARFDAMPRAAVNAGLADLILPPSDLGPALARLAAQSHFEGVQQRSGDEHILRRIFHLLRTATGVDFTHYKQPTIRRRMQRRMVLLKVADLESYLHHMENTPAEVQDLYDDLLIQVTRFFRDPETFEALAERVYPAIAAGSSADTPIRVWVPGCATGEEAYSVAMTLLEHLGDSAATTTTLQVFATDISDTAIERARVGLYPETIAEDVSPTRLRRFFNKIDAGYQIAKAVRDLCIFAHQDLARDPPFSRLGLIVCRNVLIYLDPVLHKKLMSVFHYALRPGGFLMLGRAESVGTGDDLFQLLDKKARIFSRKSSLTRLEVDFPLPESAADKAALPMRSSRQRESRGVQGEATRLLLSRYAPPGVLVDNDLHIVQARGHTGPFLELPPGDASLHLLKMAREGLLFGLRGALNEARRTGTPVRKEGLRLKSSDSMITVNVEVVPLRGDSERHFLVLFEQAAASSAQGGGRRARGKGKGKGARRAGREDTRATLLQQELAASRDYLQSIIQDLEATNEELQSANEEILSSNEELQSTNEELDTAKEELQSTNEEINTVNEELHVRNEDLSRANSDLVNLLAGVQIAIVFLTNDLRIRRFTPMAEKVLNLISADVGRPISNIRPNINCPDLEELINDVVESVAPKEREVQDKEGTWYLLRIRPYKNVVDNRIDGAVLVLLDIDAMRRQEDRLREAKELAEAVVDTVREPLVVLETDLRVRTVNKSFCRAFGVQRREAVGRALPDLDDGQWNIPRLRSLLDDMASTSDGPPVPIEGFEVVHDFPKSGRRRMVLNAQRGPASAESGRPFILLAIEEKPLS